MAVHKIQINEFLDVDYELIAIHSSVEDYRLAFFLNKILGIELYRDKLTVELRTKNGKSCFEHFLFNDEKNDVCWHLISNKSELKANDSQNIGMFDTITSSTYLVPEFKTADYVLKIENVDPLFNIDSVIKLIKEIPFITLVYTIEQNKLKSKNNLIF